MRSWLLQILKIREGELGRVLSLGLYLLLTVSTFITGRIARDALFLTVFQKEDLAYMYISVAIMVPVPAYLFARIVDRFRRDKMLIVTLLCTVACMGGARVMLLWKQPWVYIVLYNFVEIYGTFLILQFWTFSGDFFSSREAKRLFPIVSAGSVIAGIVCGFGVARVVKTIGTDNLLFVQMAMLSLAAVVIAVLGRSERDRLQAAMVRQHVSPVAKKKTVFGVTSQTKDVFHSKHLRIIAGMTVATFITVPIIDYQFKVAVKEHFSAVSATGIIVDTDAMSAFMGLFSAATGVIAAIMQLAFTGRILERFGVVFSLLLLPLTLVLGLFSALGGLLQAFYAAVFTKGAENSFRYSIHDATMQILYIPVPSSVRGRAKTFIDGIVKPLAGGIAGALMVLLVGPLHVPVTSFGIVALGLVLFWVSLIFRMRGEYVKELLATLRKRKLDFSEKRLVIDDAVSVKFLRDRLSSPNEAEVGNALELCRKVRQHDLSAELSRLLTHPSAELRISALEILSERSMIIGESQAAVDIDLVEACFNDENNDVCAAAIRTFCSLMGEPAVATIEPFLKSTAPAVRAAAVASIIRHGGLEGIVQAAEDLKAMLLSEDENVRFYCARVLQEVEIHRFYAPAQKLLADESPRVRSAAIAAAGAMLSPELVPTLIYKLRHRSTRRAAQLALAQYGEAVIDTLARVLGQRMEDAVLRRQVPRILERIGTRRALDALVHSLDADDGETRNEAARSTSRLRERLGVSIEEVRVKKLVNAEVRDHYQLLAMLFDLKDLADDPRDLLRDALDERQRKSLERIFCLLGTVHPSKAIETIWANLTSSSPARRANAVEVLDNLLSADQKRGLLPIVEAVAERSTDVQAGNRALARVLERCSDGSSLIRQTPQAWVRDLLRGKDEWLCVCALHVTMHLKDSSLTEEVVRHLASPSALLREAAWTSLSVLETPVSFLARGASVQDADQRVKNALVYLRQMAQNALPTSASASASV